jgi:hypothetical protein
VSAVSETIPLTNNPVRFSHSRSTTLTFEYGIFALTAIGFALGGVAVALGYLRSPAASMVVGDWYLLTSGFVIVAAASSRPRLIGFAAVSAFLIVAALYPVSRALGLADGSQAHIKIAVACASAMAIATQFIFALRQGRVWRENRDLAVGCFAVALVVVPLMSGWGIEASTHVAWTLDAQVLRIDDLFGLRVPARMIVLVMSSPKLSSLVFHVYISVSLAMVGYDLLFGDTRNWRMTKLMLVSSFVGFVVYFITPVVGTNFFDAYGADIPQQILLQFPVSAGHDLPRNAMPSLHTTYGLFLIAAAIARVGRDWRESVVAILFGSYGAMTICGALVFGHHFLTDCIVAVPFATAILLIVVEFESGKAKGMNALVGFGVVLFCCWVAVLRFGDVLGTWPVIYPLAAAGLALYAFAVVRLRRETNVEYDRSNMLSSAPLKCVGL